MLNSTDLQTCIVYSGYGGYELDNTCNVLHVIMKNCTLKSLEKPSLDDEN